jgi:hypothetical protein
MFKEKYPNQLGYFSLDTSDALGVFDFCTIGSTAPWPIGKFKEELIDGTLSEHGFA